MLPLPVLSSMYLISFTCHVTLVLGVAPDIFLLSCLFTVCLFLLVFSSPPVITLSPLRIFSVFQWPCSLILRSLCSSLGVLISWLNSLHHKGLWWFSLLSQGPPQGLFCCVKSVLEGILETRLPSSCIPYDLILAYFIRVSIIDMVWELIRNPKKNVLSPAQGPPQASAF